MLLILSLLLGGVLVYRKRSETIVVPLPRVAKLNGLTSLTWDMVSIPARSIDKRPDAHPGYQLAERHCTACHLLPEPAHLSVDDWPYALTWMFNYLGYPNHYGPFANIVEGDLMPSAPVIDENELRQLASYYLVHASPDERQRDNPSSVSLVNEVFDLEIPNLGIPSGQLVTLVHCDEPSGRLYLGIGSQKAIRVYERGGRLLLNKTTETEPVDIEVLENGFRLTQMGAFMEDEEAGRVEDVFVGAAGELKTRTITQNHHRLTQSVYEDLDGDGVKDMLLIGFGTGVQGEVTVCWMVDEIQIADRDQWLGYSGALCAEVHDFNRDGLNDVILVAAQNQQEIVLFLNEGERQFSRHTIRKDFAGFGYNHLSLADFNGDGRQDILIANGNNMEFMIPPLKPYHGLRVLLQSDNLQFKEVFFYPMDGALKAIAEDFDKDGDLDVAAISFYPDWSSDNLKTFVYLENQGAFSFKAHGFGATDWGRWISMDVADIDGDGWRDILLGGGYIDHGVHPDYRERYREEKAGRSSVIFLRNRRGSLKP